jgi:mRNA-degrading endonuclease RelE of RelBE toxin-antitoxin system
MRILYASHFERQYRKLPEAIREAAEEKEFIFRSNPFDRSLEIHRLRGRLKGFWAFSIGFRHRIVFEFAKNGDVIFHAVGDHDVYR